jgi:hypothetical protein
MEGISSSPNQHSRVGVEVACESRYLAPAPVAAVMWEQLEYLLDRVAIRTARTACG